VHQTYSIAAEIEMVKLILHPTVTSGSAGISSSICDPAHRHVSVPLKRFDDAVDWRIFQVRFSEAGCEGSELSLRGLVMIRAKATDHV